jgi:hypothetical protein
LGSRRCRGTRTCEFDLHADVAVPATDRARLEHLCRYLLRPAVVQDRLRQLGPMKASGASVARMVREPGRLGGTQDPRLHLTIR